MEITLAVILSYISEYLLSFVISMLGAFTTEMMMAIKKKTHMDMFRLLAPSVFIGFLSTAAQSHFVLSFELYALMCFVLGMWGLQLLEIITNHKFMFVFLKNLLKQSSKTLAKAAEEGMTEINNQIKEESTKENTTNDEKDKE